MVRRQLVTTSTDNLLHFDHDHLTSDMVLGESEYFILCMRPDERALCLTAIHYFAEYKNRWIGGWTESERLDLLGRTNSSLIKEMACSEDIDQLNTNLSSIALTLIEMRDLLGPPGGDIDGKLSGIRDQVEALVSAVTALDPTLFNDIEDVLEEINVILGGTPVTID